MTLRTPFRPLIFLAVTATVALTLIQVEATSAPDVSVVPAPARLAAPLLPSAAPDQAPAVAVEPAREPAPGGTTSELSDPIEPIIPAASGSSTSNPPDSAPPAASTVARASTSETSTDAPATAAGAPIEGLDLLEVLLRITGTLTSTPLTTQEPPADTATQPDATTNAPAAIVAPQPMPSKPAAPAAIVAPQPAPPKPAAAATTPVTRPTTSPGAQTTPTTGPLLPSVFEQAQIVSFYGYPGIGVMGELGLHTPAGAAAAVARVAAEYDALNGPREVMPALHLIVAVAQRHPGTSGLYLQRMGDERLSEYVEAAREAGILLFLDVQIGWSDALTETRLLEDALREPFVHLALDPEFATRSKGTAPGVAIGALGSADVNAVQHYLAGLVREHNLPPKVLILHQFLKSMLTGVEYYDDVAEVDVTIDMDGFGNPYVKLTKYDLYATADYAERAAIKLFYRWDVPLMTPARLLSLDNPPDLVIYQ